MDVLGQLKKAQLENTTTEPTKLGQPVFRTDTNKVQVKDSVGAKNLATENFVTDAIAADTDIGGGTASNTNRITLPKADITTLQGLTRNEGTVFYDQTTKTPYFDTGTYITQIGSSVSGNKDYIANPSAVNDLSGWSGYIDGIISNYAGGGGGPTLDMTTDEFTLLREAADKIPVTGEHDRFRNLPVYLAHRAGSSIPTISGIAVGGSYWTHSSTTFNGTSSTKMALASTKGGAKIDISGTATTNTWFFFLKKPIGGDKTNLKTTGDFYISEVFTLSTLARNTVNPIRGSADLKYTAGVIGNGIKYETTIEVADQGKLMEISLDYLLGGTGYVTGDLSVYVVPYGVDSFGTEANLGTIEPSISAIKSATGVASYKATFRTVTPDSTYTKVTKYRLMIHQTTMTNTYTMQIANVSMKVSDHYSLSYKSTGGQSIGVSPTAMLATEKRYDNAGMYNTATGNITLDCDGEFQVLGMATSPTVSWLSGSQFSALLQIDGNSEVRLGSYKADAAVSNAQSIPLNGTFKGRKGQVVTIALASTVTFTLPNAPTDNWFAVKKIGPY